MFFLGVEQILSGYGLIVARDDVLKYRVCATKDHLCDDAVLVVIAGKVRHDLLRELERKKEDGKKWCLWRSMSGGLRCHAVALMAAGSYGSSVVAVMVMVVAFIHGSNPIKVMSESI